MAATVNAKAYVGTGWKPASSTVYFKDWYEYPTTLGVETVAGIANDIQLYPNPNNGEFSVTADAGSKYEVYDIAGRKMI
jgi:hypothetical protein